MRICTVWGDLSSDKSSEAYPTDLYCEECFEAMGPNEEESGVVSWEADNGSYGDVCAGCGKTKDEELEELE